MTEWHGLAYCWVSQQGVTRALNQDAGAIIRGNGFLLAMIADGFGHHDSSHVYAKEFIAGLATLLKCRNEIGPSDCIESAKEVHARLRRAYAGARFCFALLYVGLTDARAWSLHCGDCRVGVIVDGG